MITSIDAMIMAIRDGQSEQAAQEFVAFGGDVNARVAGSGQPLLHAAVEAENLPMMRALFNLGADIEARDANGWTPLHRAVDLDLDTAGQTSWGEGDFMRHLTFQTAEAVMALGADLAACDADGRTPRDLAAEYGEKVLGKFDEAVERAQRI